MYHQVAQRTNRGRRRRHNEDALGAWTPRAAAERTRSGVLYVIADGVGGAAAGELASRCAVDWTIEEYGAAGDRAGGPGERLAAAVEAANRRLCQANRDHPERREMGTTLVAAAIVGDELHVANVGDSRAYRVRGGAAELLTQDHTVTAGMVRRGELEPGAAARHPLRSQLTRCLGLEPEVKVDLDYQRLLPGDVVVLCSDGLTRHVTDEEIAQAVGAHKARAAARALVRLANRRGGEDNVSVTIVQVCSATR